MMLHRIQVLRRNRKIADYVTMSKIIPMDATRAVESLLRERNSFYLLRVKKPLGIKEQLGSDADI